MDILGLPPTQDASGKWRFRLGFRTKNVIIRVVTVSGWGVDLMDMYGNFDGFPSLLYTLPPVAPWFFVKNGCISNYYRYLSNNIAIFHWTMIMGERVVYSLCNLGGVEGLPPVIPSVKLAVCRLPLKIGRFHPIGIFIWTNHPFSGACAVSFTEGKYLVTMGVPHSLVSFTKPGFRLTPKKKWYTYPLVKL